MHWNQQTHNSNTTYVDHNWYLVLTKVISCEDYDGVVNALFHFKVRKRLPPSLFIVNGRIQFRSYDTVRLYQLLEYSMMQVTNLRCTRSTN
jgi:hypothetical protein